MGRATCQLFAQNHINVVIVDINEENAVETLKMIQNIEPGLKHLAIKLDVSDVPAIIEFYEKVRKSYNQAANMLVNCAGITRSQLVLDTDEQTFNRLIDVHLKGTFFMAKVVLFKMACNNVFFLIARL